MRISTQTENHKLRKNVETDRKCIPLKTDLKIPNPKFNLSSMTAYILI